MARILRKLFGRTVYYTSQPILPAHLDVELIDKGIVFDFTGKKKDIKCYEEIIVPGNVKDADVFYDSTDEHVYMTNFVYDQTVLEIPVDLVAVSDCEVLIYVGDKILNFYPKALPDRFQMDSFMHKLLGVTAATPSLRTGQDNNDKFVETQQFLASDSGSEELGVETLRNPSDYSQRSQISSYENNVPCSSSSFETFTIPVTAAPASKILKTSALDKKLARKSEIESFRQKVNDFLSEDKAKRQEIVVSPEDLILTQEHASTDEAVVRMTKELAHTSTLYDFESIVVVQLEGKYHVVSGSRKVTAYKAAMQRKIHVSKISENDKDKYVLHSFFLNKGNSDGSITFLISIIRMLMRRLNLSKDRLADWNVKEKNIVFEKLAGPLTTFRFLIDVSAYSDLEESVMKLADRGLKVSNHLLRDMVRRYKVNPEGLILILNEQWDNLEKLNKAVNLVKPNVEHLLKIKCISSEVAHHLAGVYYNDDLFLEFVSCTDLRFVNRSNEQETIISKFELYKKKGSKRKKQFTTITTGTIDDEYDILLTTNEHLASEVLTMKTSIFVILLGKEAIVEPSYLLIVPDSLGVEDCFGRLQTHVSLSFSVKREGQLILPKDISTVMNQLGVRNRAVFTPPQLKTLTESLDRVFLDVGGILDEELSLSFCMEGSAVIVETQKSKKKLESFLRRGISSC